MEVKMLVGTDVIERKPGRLERRELGLYLGCKLSTDRRTGNRLECELHHSLAKPPRAIDKVGQALRWQGRAAVDQNHVQSDPQAAQTPRACNGMRGGRSCDHQARRRQDTAAGC